MIFYHLKILRAMKRFNIPFVLLILFPFYFTYDLYTNNIFYCHDAYPGMYFPFRQWFIDRLMNFEFPLWNPFWGIGHEAVIWATVPIDFYSIIEIFIKPHYEYFVLIHCMLIVIAGYYLFRKWNFDPWAAVTGSLFFFLSPLTTYWAVQFVNTTTFVAHMFIFFFMVKWFKTGKFRYVFLIGWSFFLGMFGTKLEFWFFETVFFVLLSGIAYFIMKPKKLSMIILPCVSILIAISAQVWQINLLVNALNNSKRLAIPHGLHNFFSSEMYRNLYLSLGDSYLLPLSLICILLFAGLYSKSYYRWFFFALCVIMSLLFGFRKFPFLASFLHSPLFYGALIATILTIRIHSKKHLLSAWILFMLPAYYWCNPMANFDENYILRHDVPFLFEAIWGFLVWLGCLQLRRYKTTQLAYLSILVVMLMEAHGQIVLSYLFGYVWVTGRDSYLIDFSFTILAIFGTLTYFRFRPILLLAPFIMVFSAYPNLLYTLPRKPVPNYANILISPKLPYNPFTTVPEIKKIIDKWDYLPYRRVLDPDIDVKHPVNHGSFLLEQTGNVAFHGSMVPSRFDELIDFHGYGITPHDRVAGYPSVFSAKTISRLPKANTKGFTNNFIYYLVQWKIPPMKLDILRILGVEFIITRNDALTSLLVQKLKLRNVMKLNEFNVVKLSGTLPRAFLVTNVTKESLKDFTENMKLDIQMDADEVMQAQGVYSARPVEIVEYKPEYVSIRTESPAGGYLVLSDVFHPYWSAAVDSAPAEIIPAFYAFRAVKVPAGLHKVEFFCKVPYFKTSFLISFFLISAGVLLTIRFWNRE